jgi:hypothetical protein
VITKPNLKCGTIQYSKTENQKKRKDFARQRLTLASETRIHYISLFNERLNPEVSPCSREPCRKSRAE